MSKTKQGTCTYCNRRKQTVRTTPFFDDIARGALMCSSCWNVSNRAGGEIGSFYDQEPMRVTHFLDDLGLTVGLLPIEASPLEGIARRIVKEMPEDMVYAMLAGVKLSTDFDPETNLLTIRTVNKVAVRKLGNEVQVHELV